MPLSLIAPAWEVLQDSRVSPAEIGWFIEHALMIIVAAAMTAVFWTIAEEALDD